MRPRLQLSAIAILSLVLVGCRAPAAPPQPPQSAPTGVTVSVPASSSGGGGSTGGAGSTDTSTAPLTALETGAPAASASSSATASSTSATSTSASSTSPVTVYYVALQDNGVAGTPIGCGDSIVATTSAPVSYKDKLEAAMHVLLANHQRTIGQSGLQNALWQSRLTLTGHAVSDGVDVVNLRGGIVQGGECDAPRIMAQLLNTAKAATGATKVQFYLNGVPLEKTLSLK